MCSPPVVAGLPTLAQHDPGSDMSTGVSPGYVLPLTLPPEGPGRAGAVQVIPAGRGAQP